MTETHRFGRRLEKGRWTVRDAGDLQRVIARAVESEAQWQGIAYTTTILAWHDLGGSFHSLSPPPTHPS